MKDKLFSDFAYSYLIRRVLLGDTDFQPWNLGLLVNEKDEYIKMVNFDFEYCFRNARLIPSVEQDLKFAKTFFPNEYAKFLEKVDEVRMILPRLKDLEDQTIFMALKKSVEYIESLTQSTM